ncbi:MAG: class I SAM-dependent methyltransferase [Candidatus Cloacimonadaceae bacterium]|jgi:SAM-dependent methyltransferase|nr:methyltransferase domain-containing protein [Candidatus Cloacimonadota bacterium]MDY0127949.1 class I SAM-dependent methyltransferase [Candidatus Cloacimonadaceae bacterium]MCB5255151.1 methyltransferase domain-containing protein [Candidatus Cloacimonadota bacterium]MCK9179182.1 methyltransferase domain-containing protein [Candidatus Cloacimonadota bacterium]MCK9242392.1 methyltransferase domain-containing protein [Candidatus Cloacimonadota bacterium]
MQYDPIKDRLAESIKLFPALRRILYRALDLLLLRQRYVIKEIKRYFHDGMRFYDAGAGFCQYSDFVLRSYPSSRVLATDLKTDYMRQYSFTSGPRFSYMTADLQVFRSKHQYDMAIAIDILEHIEDDVAVLKNIHSCLSPQGIFIISTPSDQDPAAKFTAEHVRPGYDKEALETKLRESGFEILSSIYSYGLWGSLSWRLMIKYPLILWGKSKLWAPVIALWYLLLFPASELLMRLDMRVTNSSGTGIIIVARKSD